MSEREPVKDVTIDNVTIDTARGQKNRYENVGNVKETNIRINAFVEGQIESAMDKFLKKGQRE